MYMPDLSTYRYWKREREDTLAVGWLSKENPFARGPVDGEVLAKLTKLAVNKAEPPHARHTPVRVLRGRGDLGRVSGRRRADAGHRGSLDTR